ncbi:hypothetical protein CEXT_3421, partial [Caerostris extrusa]
SNANHSFCDIAAITQAMESTKKDC